MIPNNSSARISLITPVMTRKRFSEHCGLRSEQVRGQSNRRNIQEIKIGHLTMVNVAWFAWEVWQNDGIFCVPTPLLEKSRFADASGLSVAQVENLIDGDHLPTQEIGRHKMVDIVSLYNRCLPIVEPATKPVLVKGKRAKVTD